MENLPFLQQTDPRPEPPPPPPPEEEWSLPQPIAAQPEGGFLKNINPLTILLIGIVIGVIVVSMRPIIVQKL